jgi:hypothetical protein
MKTLKDAAVLLILITLLVSVRITPLEEPQGIIPEAQAATDRPAEAGAVPALRAVESGSAQPDAADDCPLRHGSRVIVIEVDQVDQPAPPGPAVDIAVPTC